MATLDNSNIVNGNIIQPNDLLQLYLAFTAGGGYNVSISGSITGSATSATTSTTATSASNITTAITGGGTHYLTFVDQAGTRPPKIASLLEYTAATNTLQVTASRAVTASYALNGGSTATQVNNQRYIDSGIPATVNSGNFKFVAGGGILNSGVITSSAYPDLAGKILGRDAWITATYIGDIGTVTTVDPTLIVNLSSSGAIIIEQKTPQDDAQIVWTGMFI